MPYQLEQILEIAYRCEIPVIEDAAEAFAHATMGQLAPLEADAQTTSLPHALVYTNSMSEALFKVGICLPAGPYVTDDDAHYIVDTIKELIVD